MKPCPCCGQSMIGLPALEVLKEIKLSSFRATLVNMLVECWPRTMSKEDIIFNLYLRRDEPENSERVLHTTVCRVNLIIKDYGWIIINRSGGGQGCHARYCIKPLSKIS